MSKPGNIEKWQIKAQKAMLLDLSEIQTLLPAMVARTLKEKQNEKKGRKYAAGSAQLEFIQSGDDFARGLFTCIVSAKFYKVSRIIKRRM